MSSFAAYLGEVAAAIRGEEGSTLKHLLNANNTDARQAVFEVRVETRGKVHILATV
jgi:hypothetical protein